MEVLFMLLLDAKPRVWWSTPAPSKPPLSMQKRLRGHYRIIEIVPLAAESQT